MNTKNKVRGELDTTKEDIQRNIEHCFEVINEMSARLAGAPWTVVMECFCHAGVEIAVENGLGDDALEGLFNMVTIGVRMDKFFEAMPIAIEALYERETIASCLCLWRESLRRCGNDDSKAKRLFEELYPLFVESVSDRRSVRHDVGEMMEVAMITNEMYEEMFSTGDTTHGRSLDSDTKRRAQ